MERFLQLKCNCRAQYGSYCCGIHLLSQSYLEYANIFDAFSGDITQWSCLIWHMAYRFPLRPQSYLGHVNVFEAFSGAKIHPYILVWTIKCSNTACDTPYKAFILR